MSWSKVKKINGDMKKSLDTLIKEQFNTNNSNVSTVKNDLTTVKSDLAYIKNTQLGTNLNNLLQGSTGSTVSFINKPLVDKINYLLLSSENLILTTSSSNVLASNNTEISVLQESIGAKQIIVYTPKTNGQVSVEVEMKYSSNIGLTSGLFVSTSTLVSEAKQLATANSTTYTKKNITLSVNKGENLYFYLISKERQRRVYCRNFKILGDVAFKNLY